MAEQSVDRNFRTRGPGFSVPQHSTDPQKTRSRATLGWAATLLAVAGAVIWSGFRLGKWTSAGPFRPDVSQQAVSPDETATPETPSLFAVQGNSMAPTLVGLAREWMCDQCSATVLLAQNAASEVAGWHCPHCGRKHTISHQEPVRSVPPSVVAVRPSKVYNRGDIVAATWEGEKHIKRVIGIPGDVIRIEGTRILVNEIPAADAIWKNILGATPQIPSVASALILVSGDPRRWRQVTAPDASSQLHRWKRKTGDSVTGGEWTVSGRSDWLVYEHRDVHSDDMRSVVLDDYHFNLGLRRKLHPVDRLAVELTCETFPGKEGPGSSLSFQVAYWTADGVREHRFEIEPSQSAADTSLPIQCLSTFYDSALAPDSEAPVSDQSPISIRLIDGGAVRSVRLTVQRFIHYALKRGSDTDRFPIRLGENEYYLVGDNIPISVDSREVGPISRRQILGRCSPLSSMRPSESLTRPYENSGPFFKK